MTTDTTPGPEARAAVVTSTMPPGVLATTPPVEPPPVVAPATAGELVAAAAVARMGEASPTLPPPAEPDLPALEPVRLPRKGGGLRLKNKLLGATARENWIEVLDPETNEIEECLLLSPTVTQSDRILWKAMQLPDMKASEMEDAKENLRLKDVSMDQAELKVQALICCLRDPETRQPLLDQTHREALLHGPLTYLFEALAEEARAMLNPSISKAKKNSKRTRGA